MSDKSKLSDDIEKNINKKFRELEDKVYNLSELIINNISKGQPYGLIVYRTEKAHSIYKEKSVWGEGLYFGLYKDEVTKMTTDPYKFNQVPDTESVKQYIIPPETKLKGFNLNQMNTEEFNEFPSGNVLKNQILSEGYDGIIILTDELNFGGNQIIIYNKEIIYKIINRNKGEF